MYQPSKVEWASYNNIEKKNRVRKYLDRAAIDRFAYKVAIIPEIRINRIFIQDKAEMRLTETKYTCSDNRHDPVEFCLCRPTIPTGRKHESLASRVTEDSLQ